MSDKNRVVRFTAAAAVIRLTTVTARNQDMRNKGMKDASCPLGSKSTDPGCVNALSIRKTVMTTN
jgi:hypothetical protein